MLSDTGAMDTTTKQPTPTPTNPDKLWVSAGGEIACTAHLGWYATEHLSVRPAATVVRTPLDTWRIMSSARQDSFAAVVGFPAACETCQAQERAA